jgi:hypothetical protein
VRDWLDVADVRYSAQVSFIGHSGFARKFDFLIPEVEGRSGAGREDHQQPRPAGANSVIMDWLDTREVRPESSWLYAFINDNHRDVSSGVVTRSPATRSGPSPGAIDKPPLRSWPPSRSLLRRLACP